MRRRRRKFEAGFKQQIVSEVESGMLSVNAASRKYQLAGSVIDRWRQQARQVGLETRRSAREKTLERENRELEEQLAELYLENAQLKKLGDWLSQRKNVFTSVITPSEKSVIGEKPESSQKRRHELPPGRHAT